MPGSDIHINIVFEDILSASIAEKLLKSASNRYVVHRKYHGRGSGYIRSHITKFNEAARYHPYLILIDLDTTECAPILRNKLLPSGISENLILRIPVPEIEAWLLADHVGISKLIGISNHIVHRSPEQLPDPKKHLFSLVKRSCKRKIRESILPSQNSTAKIGPDYNAVLTTFVNEQWSISRACRRSYSLSRAIDALRRFASD